MRLVLYWHPSATEVVLFSELGENEVFSGTSGLLHCVRNDGYHYSLFTVHYSLYGWSELAIAYNPEVRTETARKRLRQWVLRNPRIQQALEENGYVKGARLLTPEQVRILVRFLGEP
ncbi:MAG: DUF4248 domain-containing protein [Tannerellaceae bacterium]|nr:DUF4248 domain-containing protein [Tannerellaceae bacterium]